MAHNQEIVRSNRTPAIHEFQKIGPVCMEKVRLKLNDLCFYGDLSSSRSHDSKFIEWDRTGGSNGLPVFFTDSCLNLAGLPCYKESYKIAWILEPIAINPSPYHYVAQNHSKFDLVLSHHDEFIKSIPNAKFDENCMCWISKQDFALYPKTKNVSIIASEKNWTEGHRLRHELIANVEEASDLDIFGKNYGGFVQHKIDIIRDYKFHVAIENCKASSYFTEKIIDAFVTGTVPIYWGCPTIDKFFNRDGILFVNSLNDLKYAVHMANNEPNLYEEMLPAIRDNFQIAQEYLVAEDRIYKNILVPANII